MAYESESTRLKLTRSQALKRLRVAQSGTRFYAHVSMSIAIEGDEEHHYPTGKRTSMKLTRQQALDLCREYVSEKGEAKGDRIPFCVHVMKGSAFTKDSVSYWIG